MSKEKTNKVTKVKFKRSLFRKILNSIIAFFSLLIFLIVIFFGFSQTHTFREFLRHKIIDSVNRSTRGKLFIEKIDGSILTSLFLKNTTYITGPDTLLSAEKIELKTSPLHLLLRKIYIRKIEIKNSTINLVQDPTGVWNYERININKPGSKEDAVENDENSDFPFAIFVNDLTLKNINFTRKSKNYIDSKTLYKKINFDDFRVDNLFLKSSISINLKKHNIKLRLFDLSGYPNFRIFKLRRLSGDFIITDKFARVNNLHLITDSTNIKLDAQLDSLDLLGAPELRDFNFYPLKIKLNSKSFYFDDLSTFIEGTSILKGKIAVQLSANGRFGNFDVKKLIVDFQNTHLDLDGYVKNLHIPKKLFLDVNIKNSVIYEKDALSLLPTVSIPDYRDLVLNNLNVSFKGEPTRFHSVLNSNVNNGNIHLDGYLDLQANEPEYDVAFNTNNLDLSSIFNTNTLITGEGKLVGKSFSPTKMLADIFIKLNKSYYNGYSIDSLTLKSTAKSKIIDLNFDALINNSKTNIVGVLDLNNAKEPKYNLTGNSKRLNLALFTKDSTTTSDLNFKFSAKGRSLDIDSMNAEFLVKLDSSNYAHTEIDNTDLKLILKYKNHQRNISLFSDLIDFNIEGNFSLKKAVELLTYEGNTISSIITNKLEELNPVNLVSDSLIKNKTKLRTEQIAGENISFNYNFVFKNLDLLSILTQSEKLEIDGSGNGSVRNNANNFSISTNLDIDYFLNKNDDQLIYASDLHSTLHFSRDNTVFTFNNLFGSISFDGGKLFFGNQFEDITADLIFNQSKLVYNLSASFNEDIQAEIEGNLEMKPDSQIVNIENLLVDYKNTEWGSDTTATIIFSNNFMEVKNLIVNHENTNLQLNGILEDNGDQNFNLKLQNLSGSLLSKYIFNLDDQYFDSNINMYASLKGNLDSPKVNLTLNVKDISYSDVNFGNLISNIKYENKFIKVNTSFIDSTKDYSKPILLLNGYAPIDLRITNVKDRLIEDENLHFELVSNNFNLATFSNILPLIKNVKGNLNTNITLDGTYSNPKWNGFLKLKKGNFIARPTNLIYGLDANFIFSNDDILLKKIVVKNLGNSNHAGKLSGSGHVNFNGFKLSLLKLNLEGNIALLSQYSKTVSPTLFGDLFISTSKPLQFEYKNRISNLKGSLKVEDADIIYSNLEQGNNLNDRNIIYRFSEDTTKLKKNEIKFRKFLSSFNKKITEVSEDKLNLNYDVDINIEKNAKMQFILSPVLNQKLTVETRGRIKFESQDGIARTQGELKLLEGSKLEFFKIFDATGSIRFESDLTDPYLDVVATYIGERIKNYNTNETEEVAVKLKIQSPLSKLSENLSKNKDIFSVYVGRENIQNDVANTEYDASNAISFILLGQLSLNKELNPNEQSRLATIGENAAYSLLGSTLTSFVNSAVGDVISNIQLKKSGEVVFSGRVKNIKYSFGGNTQYFQIDKANIKVEYLFNPNFLIRLEQKDPVVETATEEKVRELGLKYNFRF